MKKYNILTVAPFFPPDQGGLSFHVLNLTRNLAELGDNITIIAPTKGNDIKSKYDELFKKVYRLNSFFPSRMALFNS